MNLVSFGSFFTFAFVLSATSLTGLAIVFSGWGRRSSFSLLGSIRAVVQFLSYEIVFSFLWFLLFFLGLSFSQYELMSVSLLGFVFCLFFVFLYLFTMVAEAQRAPFDFAEGESELVRGFNTEFSSLLFSLIFLREYGLLMYAGGVLFVALLGEASSFLTLFLTTVLIVLVVGLRGIRPRLRYDLLQMAA